MLRKSSVFTGEQKANVKVLDYDFVSQRLLDASEMETPDLAQTRILQHAFNAPIIIKDYRAFF